MTCQVFKIENLLAERGKRPQRCAFARSGASAKYDQAKSTRQFRQVIDYRTTIRPVAAVEFARSPTDSTQDIDHGVGAAAAAPAIDQGPPLAKPIVERCVEMTGNVSCNQRRTHAARLEGRDLFVQRPDAGAFLVVQNRTVQRPWNMILGEFGGRADIDHLVKVNDLCYGHIFECFHRPVSPLELMIRFRRGRSLQQSVPRCPAEHELMSESTSNEYEQSPAPEAFRLTQFSHGGG